MQIECINCNGTGKVSSGIWFDEMEQFLEKEIICPICKGKGRISISQSVLLGRQEKGSKK